MKITIVVVGTLFVILVLGYLFQQKGLKEGVLDRDDIPRYSGEQGETPFNSDGPGDHYSATWWDAVGKDGKTPVDRNVHEPQRLGIDSNPIYTSEEQVARGPPYTITDPEGNVWKTNDEPEPVGEAQAGYAHEIPGVPNNRLPGYRVLDEEGNETGTLFSPDLNGTLPSQRRWGQNNPQDDDLDDPDPSTVSESTDDVV